MYAPAQPFISFEEQQLSGTFATEAFRKLLFGNCLEEREAGGREVIACMRMAGLHPEKNRNVLGVTYDYLLMNPDEEFGIVAAILRDIQEPGHKNGWAQKYVPMIESLARATALAPDEARAILLEKVANIFRKTAAFGEKILLEGENVEGREYFFTKPHPAFRDQPLAHLLAEKLEAAVSVLRPRKSEPNNTERYIDDILPVAIISYALGYAGRNNEVMPKEMALDPAPQPPKSLPPGAKAANTRPCQEI